MRKPLQSPHNMKPQGVGPKIFRNAMPALILGILSGIFLKKISHFPIAFTDGIRLTGIALISIGVIIYITSLVQFLREFPKGNLITSGVYRLSRNPLYSSFILFVFPGLSLAFNNWIFLLASVSMYVSLLVLIKDEETQLESIFGKEYTDYKRKVGRVGFFPRF
jgi:protein-S-isoprenylcysteine O-methyltransferase Ste14